MASFPNKNSVSEFIRPFRITNFDDAFKKEIYSMFHRYILRPKYSKMWGFPFIDEDGKVRHRANQFSKLQESDIEKCRCGKQIFLQCKNWHLDENGCQFHPGKLLYSDKHSDEVFTCCGRKVSSSGCVRRSHHVSSVRVCHEDDFVKTVQKRDSYLTSVPNIFALDCEMVYTTKGMEVVKVTVMTVSGGLVYDTFVRPRNPVIDYNTEFSGIDESHLAGVTVDLKKVQLHLLELFDTETILVGHGLENDLLCLNLYHSKVIDTSVLFPHKNGYPWRHSLKTLAMTHLNKLIHCSSKGHDSREDARICIELVALKVFSSKCKEMKKKHCFVPPQMPPRPPQNGIPPPHFGPRPSCPMNWNSFPTGGYPPRPPPPNPYASFLQARHPLLSFPLYRHKLNPIH